MEREKTLGSLERLNKEFMTNLKRFYKNKKILITGNTGFKGSWLTQILTNFQAKIVGLGLPPPTDPNLFQILSLDRLIKTYYGDIRDYSFVRKVIKKVKPEIIFHLAAQSLVRDSYDNPLYTFETNIIGTANILQAIKEVTTVKAALLITTDKVYENKENGIPFKEDDKLGGYDPYSASKAAADIIINSYIKSFFNPRDFDKKHKTLIASARSGNVIGGGDWQKDRLIPDIVRAILEKKEQLVIRSPEAIRPWQYVIEVLFGYLLLVEKLYKGKKEFSGAWNFGPTNKNCLTVKELLEKALEILGGGSYIISNREAKHEAQLLLLDSSKAKKSLGWQSKLAIDRILRDTFIWYKKFYQGEKMIDFTNQQINSFLRHAVN